MERPRRFMRARMRKVYFPKAAEMNLRGHSKNARDEISRRLMSPAKL